MVDIIRKEKEKSSIYWVLAACALAAVLRIWLPWNSIFASGHINFSGTDSYYQMNIIRQVFDGMPPAGISTLYAQFIIGLAWLISWGNPTFHLIEVVATFVPVLFAVGTVAFVYCIGRLLHSRMAGCIAAFTVAVLPGEYFARSWLGSVDYHAAEVFLTTGAILFFILLWKNGKSVGWRAAVYILVAYACVAAYFKIWPGSVGFAPILVLFTALASMRLLSCNKWLSRIFIAIITAGFCFIAFVLLQRISGISSFITANTAEAQPGWTDILIILHILLTMILSFIYFRIKGMLRLPVIFWSVVMAAAAFWQRRFDYYLVIPFAVLMGSAITSYYQHILNWDKEKEALTEKSFALIQAGEKCVKGSP